MLWMHLQYVAPALHTVSGSAAACQSVITGIDGITKIDGMVAAVHSCNPTPL